MRPRRVWLIRILLTWLTIGCSDSITGARGPDGEILRTVLSATSARVGDTVSVGLEVTNPKSRELTLALENYTGTDTIVFAQFSRGSTTYGIAGGRGAFTTAALLYLSLPANADTTLAPTRVRFVPEVQVDGFGGSPPNEFYLPSGPWSVRACVLSADNFEPVCGNRVAFTMH